MEAPHSYRIWSLNNDLVQAFIIDLTEMLKLRSAFHFDERIAPLDPKVKRIHIWRQLLFEKLALLDNDALNFGEEDILLLRDLANECLELSKELIADRVLVQNGRKAKS
jgi:hypothetical protein